MSLSLLVRKINGNLEIRNYQSGKWHQIINYNKEIASSLGLNENEERIVELSKLLSIVRHYKTKEVENKNKAKRRINYL